METIFRYSLAIISFLIVVMFTYVIGFEVNTLSVIIGGIIATIIRFTVAEWLVQRGYAAKYMILLNSFLYFVAAFVICVLIVYIVLSIVGVPESTLGTISTISSIVISLLLTYRSAKKNNQKIEQAVEEQL